MTAPFQSLAEVKVAILKPEFLNMQPTGPWSLSQILEHCEQSVRYSLEGFPKMKPKLIRMTIGKLVSNKFLRQKYMKHNLTAEIPGAPELQKAKSVEVARDEFVATIDRFLSHTKDVKPHFVFGDLGKAKFDTLQALHFADHYQSLRKG